MGNSLRCKVGGYKGSRVLRYASSTKNPLDAQIVRLMEQGFPSIFLPFSVVPLSSHSSEVHYDVTRFITLSEYVKSATDEAKLLAIFDQYKQLFETCSALNLLLKNVMFDANQVYCDPWENHSLKFLLLPFGGIDPDMAALNSFFVNFPKKVRNADPASKMLLGRYAAYFQRTTAFNPTEFMDFLTSLSRTPGTEVAARNDARFQSAAPVRSKVVSVVPSASSRPAHTAGTSASNQEKLEQRGRHVRIDPGTSALNTIDWRMLTNEDVSEGGAAAEEQGFGTTELNEDISEEDALREIQPNALSKPGEQPPVFSTTVLDKVEMCSASETLKQEPQQPQPVKKPPLPQLRYWLTRQGTGERFELTGDSFSVGKSKYASYQVKNTTTVSRIHARFCCTSTECWIEDNSSTNKTFINERQLVPCKREKLVDGVVVRMSDEYFTFEECHS